MLKGRYKEGTKVLDAGCGNGRNIELFLKNEFVVYGVDKNEEVINTFTKNHFSEIENQFQIPELDKLPFENNFFNHIICNAVLHFAKSTSHFYGMFQELVRVLKPKGTLFIRMTSTFGIEDKLEPLGNGVYKIPDGTTRFLLNEGVLEQLISEYNVKFLEPLKTVNLNNSRCMSNLILEKVD